MNILPWREHKTAQTCTISSCVCMKCNFKNVAAMRPKNSLRNVEDIPLILAGSSGKEFLKSFNYQIFIDYLLCSPLCPGDAIPALTELSG